MKAHELDLQHAIQARRINATFGLGWETIAAFNSEHVASRYMAECREANRAVYEYRQVPVEP